MKPTSEQKNELILLAVCTALLGVLMLTETDNAGGAVVFALLYLLAGGSVFIAAVKNIFLGRVFDEQLLMSVAAIGAFCIGSYAEGAAVLILYRVGEVFSDMATQRARRSISELMDIRPDRAVVLTEAGESCEAPENVPVGAVTVVRAGERIPLDGEIVSGSASLDTASLTGETMPRAVSAGDAAVSGCVCLDGVLHVRVTAPYGESTVARIIRLAETASEKKAPTEKFITRFSRHYTPAVLLLVALYAVGMPLLLGGGWIACLHNALTFLVISCPCALVLSVPLAFFCGCGSAARRGILIKGGACMESLASLKTVVFDKTGTLTTGEFEISRLIADGISDGELLRYAALAEYPSEHPIAAAVRAAFGQPIDASQIEAATVLGGYGVRVRACGMHILAGSARLMREEGITGELPAPADGETAVFIAADGVFRGLITFTDRLKPDAAAAVTALRENGVSRIAVFSGDSTRAAQSAAERTGADVGIGDLLPADKCALLEAEIRAGRTAFVGDGVNDAPAIARADTGIAMGALGSDAAVEAADVVLMGDEPSKVADTVAVAKRTLMTARENIWLTLIVKAVVLVLAALGYAPMWAAEAADVGATVAAVCNSVFSSYLR